MGILHYIYDIYDTSVKISLTLWANQLRTLDHYTVKCRRMLKDLLFFQLYCICLNGTAIVL